MNYKHLLLISILYVIPSLSNYKPIGIDNIGNVCFMNSVLQCLYHSKNITNFLLNTEALNYYKPKSIATEYIKFLETYSVGLGENQTINPIDWCQRIWSLEEGSRKLFPETHPADASEFLTITLGHLGLDPTISDVEPSKIFKRKPYPLQNLADDAIVNSIGLTLKQYSLDNRLTSVKNEPLMSVDIVDTVISESRMLDIPKASLETCIDDYFKTQNLRIFDLPKYLIISLNRFRGTMEETEKIKNAIPFPLKLNLKNYLDEYSPYGLSPDYELYGIVIHTDGHYISYVKVNGKWWECNDTRIKEIASEYIEAIANISGESQDMTPYILFYRQEESENLIYTKNEIDMEIVKFSVIAKLPDLIDQLMGQLLGVLEVSKPETVSKYLTAIDIMNVAKENEEILVDSYSEYIESNKINLDSIKESLEKSLIDEDFLASQVAVYIQDVAKKNLFPGQEFRAKIIAEQGI